MTEEYINYSDIKIIDKIAYLKRDMSLVTGEVVNRFSNGYIQFIHNFKDGKEVVVKRQDIVIFSGIASLKEKAVLVTGKIRGWWKNGQLAEEGTYFHGRSVGVWRHWDRFGKLCSEEIIIDSEHIIRIDGITYLKHDMSLVTGKVREWRGDEGIWYGAGEPLFEEITYKEGKENGPNKRWDDNDQLRFEGIWKDGKKYGVHKKYNKDGQLFEEIPYRDGNIDGILKMYNVDGKIVSEANYKEGKQDGVHTLWNEEGEILFEIFYKDGEVISL
ncbi:toxin-antitoxin system YwqK family antitoxin [Formosa maritima]|uniref:Toxin-antitoxin system YwqK family antitoxin n=1 Tax=Formosa maritima TaxID=2592046 RepID=A0A5D0G2S4_9FLAO|nr:toxin-antitoxin system YwqK family antitoxin [Formosa maritima]TYA53044.1 toxin-antitoxin system YwqK family antitoxin [Formosa maritima]